MTSSTASPGRLEQVYDFIIREEDGRTCEAIPDAACTDVPRNFILNALNGSATKLAEQIASPGLVLPWLLAALGASTALAGSAEDDRTLRPKGFKLLVVQGSKDENLWVFTPGR